jgi:hypothetical protein
MSISKRFLRKLAVAALAVAGVVGMAGTAVAQGPIVAEMGVSITVERKEKIEPIPNAAFNVEEFMDSKTGSVVAGPITAKVPGNLGLIKVTTNSASWDVEMYTKWGGKLVLEGAPTADAVGPQCASGTHPDPWDASKCLNLDNTPAAPPVQGYSPGTAKALRYKSGSTYSDVGLEIAIGIADSGKNLSPSATLPYYPLGAPSDYNDFSPIDVSTSVGATNKYVIVPNAAPTENPSIDKIKFASEVFIGSYGNMIDPIKTPNSWASGMNTASLASFGALSSLRGETAYFYINVGLDNNATAPLPFGGNDPGVYSETLYFDLVADF